VGVPVVTVAKGGLPVVSVTSGGMLVEEAANGFGLAITQVAAYGMPVTYAVLVPTIIFSGLGGQLENTAIGTAIGNVSVINGTGTYTFTKTADPDAAFTFTSPTLKNSIVYDFETKTSHSVTIRADNGAGGVINQTFIVPVIDVDEVAPVITTSATQTVAENSAFSVTLTADKPVTWSKTGGADTALFTLASGVLSLPAKDFEDVHGPAYVVQVTAASVAFPAAVTNKTITVNVSDVAGPTITSSATQTVAENSAFSMTLTASASATFAKTGGADAALFTLSGATLSLPAQDYEDVHGPAYVVQLKATSTTTGEVGPGFTITVNITDVVEATNYLLLTNASNYLLLAATGKLVLAGGALLGADLVDGSGNTLVDGSSNTLTAS
jgi:hypothetical protein